MLRNTQRKKAESRFHVIFDAICFFINENVAKNNWLQKFKKLLEKFYDEVLTVFRL